MASTPMIPAIHQTFSRHERRYCIFSVNGSDEEFLYYSHASRPLRSLMFGRDFIGQLLPLMEKEDLCIECGLGLLVTGGVALDNGDRIAWHCTADEANRIVVGLKERLGVEGRRIESF
jgi:hypothetical protein